MEKWPVSISTVICRSMPLDQALRAVAEAGFRFVEISSGHAFALVKTDYMALLDDLHLKIGTVHLPFVGMNISSLDDGARQETLGSLGRLIDASQRYAVPTLILHPNSYERVRDRQEYVLRQQAFARSVAWLTERAFEANTRLAIENMIGPRSTRFGGFASDIIHWVREEGNPVLGVCLDTTHGILNGEDIVSAVFDAKEQLIAIHASDNLPGKHLHTVPGRGEVDWFSFVSALRQVGYEGLFTMEIYETKNWQCDLKIAREKAEDLSLLVPQCESSAPRG